MFIILKERLSITITYIPRTDIAFYRYLNGIILGLIFSSEVFDAVSTLLTSSDTIILSEAEYNEENYNK